MRVALKIFAAAGAGVPGAGARRNKAAATSPTSSTSSSASRRRNLSVPSPSSSSPAPSPLPSSAVVENSVAECVVSVRHVHEYRRNVGICLVNRHGKVFCARRVDDKHGSWQMPQGGIDHLENPLAAAARELREETGIVSARVVAISRDWTRYDSPTRVADPARPGQPGAVLSYRGQTQKWVLMVYYGDEEDEGEGEAPSPSSSCGCSEVDLGPEGTREFSEWAWRDLGDVARGVVPFKRRAYEAVAREFGPVIAARVGGGRGSGSGGSGGSGRGGGGGEGASSVGGGAAARRSWSDERWWGLNHHHHNKQPQQQQRYKNQILPASGVVMKQQQQHRQQQEGRTTTTP